VSIWAYVGLPRQGKSFHAVKEQIFPALRDGRRVVTNIQLVPEALQAAGCTGEVLQLTNDDLAKDKAAETLKRIGPGDLVVFDEMWRYLPQGMRSKDLPAEWGALFAEHGHMVDARGVMTQIVFVVQDLSNISSFARSLVERTVLVTKLEVIGSGKRYRVDTYAGNVTGLKPPISKRISEEFGSFDAKYFDFYVSRTKSQAGVGTQVNEKALSNRGSVFRNPAVRFGLPVAAGLFLFGLWRLYMFFFPSPEPSSAPVFASQDANKPPRPSRPVPANQAMRYRVAGFMRFTDETQSVVWLDHCDGTPQRRIQWFAARCLDTFDGGVACEWRGRKYEFHAPIHECRSVDESRSSEGFRLPFDVGRSRESVSPGV
jgi:zona occludens toxin